MYGSEFRREPEDEIPVKALVAFKLHGWVNRLAWKYARPAPHACGPECIPAREEWKRRQHQMDKQYGTGYHRRHFGQPRFHGPDWGIANRIDDSHPLWRLNKWLSSKWIPYWMGRYD